MPYALSLFTLTIAFAVRSLRAMRSLNTVFVRRAFFDMCHMTPRPSMVPVLFRVRLLPVDVAYHMLFRAFLC